MRGDTRRGGGRSSAWKWAGRLYAALFFGFLYLPILVLAILSFNDSQIMGFPLRGFTSGWYREALADGNLLLALRNSLALGVASAAGGTALALSAILGLRRRPSVFLMALPVFVVPIIMPGIVTGVIMLVFFGMAGVRYGLWTAFVVHVSWVMPFAMLTLYPRLVGLDRAIEEAAMDLGATPLALFRRIVLPLIRPAVLGTFLFAFTLSFDEFVRSFFVVGSARTLPVHLWILITEQVAPFLPAVGVIIMMLTATVAAVAFIVSARTPEQRQATPNR